MSCVLCSLLYYYCIVWCGYYKGNRKDLLVRVVSGKETVKTVVLLSNKVMKK